MPREVSRARHSEAERGRGGALSPGAAAAAVGDAHAGAGRDPAGLADAALLRFFFLGGGAEKKERERERKRERQGVRRREEEEEEREGGGGRGSGGEREVGWLSLAKLSAAMFSFFCFAAELKNKSRAFRSSPSPCVSSFPPLFPSRRFEIISLPL